MPRLLPLVPLLALGLAHTAAAQSFGFASGPVKLASAEAIAFGPPGILFVGDSTAGSVVALDTGDRTAAPSADSPAGLTGIDQKIAALLGIAPTQLRFNDLKVNPASKAIYLAASRGLGPDAIPVLIRIATDGALSIVDTAGLPHAAVTLPGLPSATNRRGRNPRRLAITDLQYTDGKLLIAGLSNEDFSSTLRVVPFPFTKADRGASVEIFHTSHNIYETSSPVRTMAPYRYKGEQYVLAAYTCTPLVKLRLSDLADGAKVTGDTLAELGRHSSPIDMIQYRRDGHDFLLVANTLWGLMSLSLDNLENYEPVTEDGGDPNQIPRHKVADMRSIAQMAAYDDTHAIVLLDQRSRLDLRLIPLP